MHVERPPGGGEELGGLPQQSDSGFSIPLGTAQVRSEYLLITARP